MKKGLISIFLKGLCVGGTMLVPGVSGGSMAMILGIYDKLIASISSFMKNVKGNLLFLGVFCIGSVLGMIIFAKPLLALIESYTFPMLYLFMGAVAGGIPMIYKKASLERFSIKSLLYPLIGILIVLIFAIIPTGFFEQGNHSGIMGVFLTFVAGIIAAIALILPGISVSYMLLLMGMYDTTMQAISNFDLVLLLPLLIGLGLGIILTTRALESAMERYPTLSYLIILGFVVGSLAQVFPGIPALAQIPSCILAFAIGLLLIFGLSKVDR